MRTQRLLLSTLALSVLAAGALARHDDAVTIATKYVKGAVTYSTVQVEMSFAGQDSSIKVSLESKTTTTDVDAATGNCTQLGSSTNIVVKQNDNVLQQIDSTPESKTVTDKFGKLVSVDDPNGGGTNAFVLSRAAGMVFPDHPVKIGDSWGFDFPADKDKETNAATTTYTLKSLGMDGTRQTAIINTTYKETTGDTPTTSKGTVEVYLDNGDLKSGTFNMENFPTQMGAAKTAVITVTAHPAPADKPK